MTQASESIQRVTASPGSRGAAAAKKSGQPTTFRTDVQGLRAFAVLAVVLYHVGIPFLPGGYVGVDVFFVISGFLITSHLLDGLAQDGRVHFASFYAKRARRILPASLLVLVATVLAAAVWLPPLLMSELWRGALATALYIPNVLFAFDGINYLAETVPSLFQHYWSLGIEEQFYLVWPLLLSLGWRRLHSRRSLFLLLLFVVVTSFVCCVVVTFWRQPWAFFLLPTRGWELGVGGIVAFLLMRARRPLGAGSAAVAGWVGMAAIVAPVFLFSATTPFPGYWAAIPAVGTALIVFSGASPSRYSPTRVLSLPPMLFVGAISYSLYLIHWPALVLPQIAVGVAHPLPLSIKLSIATLCVPLAWLLYRAVENPARSARWLVRARPRRSLLVAAGGSVVAVVLASAVFNYSENLPLHSDRAAPAPTMTEMPVGTAFVPSNLEPSLTEASSDRPVVYDDGCHQPVSGSDLPDCTYGTQGGPRIVLFGDSHAAQWLPALERFASRNGYTVVNRSKSSCPSLMTQVQVNGVPYADCDLWREKVFASLAADPPVLVVMSNYVAQDMSGDTERWSEALRRSLDRMSVPVVVIADTPDMAATPAICLSANLTETKVCSRARDEATHTDVSEAERAVAESARATYVDLTDFFCGTKECAPILGDALVYRDGHHITTHYAQLLSPILEPLLLKQLRE